MSVFKNRFSQSRQVEERMKRGLHPIDEVSRFYLLVCCFFCSATVSITYAFDLITGTLQSQFGLSAGDLTTVSTVGLVFGYFIIPYSLIYRACGPFILYCISFTAGGLGALLMGLAVSGRVRGTTGTFAVYYAFLSIASGIIDLAYISTLAQVFPRNRGPVLALAKVMTSLGTSALASICVNLFDSNIQYYFYFLMSLVMTVSLWAAFTVTLPPYFMNWWRLRGKTPEQVARLESLKHLYNTKFVPKPRLIAGYAVVISMLIFYAVVTPVVAYAQGVSRASRRAIGSISVMLIFCIFIIAMPFKCLGGVDEPLPEGEEKEEYEVTEEEPVALRNGEHADGATATEENRITHKPVVDSDGISHAKCEATSVGYAEAIGENAPRAIGVAPVTRQDPRYPGTVKDYLCSLDLWLIFLLTMTNAALGLILSYNSSTISIAMSGSQRSTQLSALYTAFLGIGSSLGRFAMGLFEAYVQHQKPGQRKVIITMGLMVAPAIATIGGILILTLPGKMILFPFILIYFENGWTAAVNALIFPCLFETDHSALYSFNFFFVLLTIVIFNRLLFGMYTDHMHKKLNYRVGQSCSRPECVRVPIIVLTCMAFMAVFVALTIHIRYSRFLRRAHKQALVSPDRADLDHADAAEMRETVTPSGSTQDR